MPIATHTTFALPYLAAGAITAYKGVAFDGTVANATGERIIGIAETGASSGEYFTVNVSGTCKVIIGDTVTVGQPLMMKSDGTAIPAVAMAATVDSGATPVTSSAANGAVITLAGSIPPAYIFGYALSGGSSGATIEVLLRG